MRCLSHWFSTALKFFTLIPKKNVSSDYVRDYEEITEKKIREHEQKKYRENRIDDFLNEFQTPIFIILLYFLFQLPIVNTMIFKRCVKFKLKFY